MAVNCRFGIGHVGWLAAQPEVTYQQTTTSAHPYRLNDVSASFVIAITGRVGGRAGPATRTVPTSLG